MGTFKQILLFQAIGFAFAGLRADFTFAVPARSAECQVMNAAVAGIPSPHQEVVNGRVRVRLSAGLGLSDSMNLRAHDFCPLFVDKRNELMLAYQAAEREGAGIVAQATSPTAGIGGARRVAAVGGATQGGARSRLLVMIRSFRDFRVAARELLEKISTEGARFEAMIPAARPRSRSPLQTAVRELQAMKDFTESLVRSGDSQLRSAMVIAERLGTSSREMHALARESGFDLSDLASMSGAPNRDPATAAPGLRASVGREASSGRGAIVAEPSDPALDPIVRGASQPRLDDASDDPMTDEVPRTAIRSADRRAIVGTDGSRFTSQDVAAVIEEDMRLRYGPEMNRYINPGQRQVMSEELLELANRNGGETLEERREYISRYLARVSQESRFQPSAVSSMGAQGLTQIMPATWQDLRGQGEWGQVEDYMRSRGLNSSSCRTDPSCHLYASVALETYQCRVYMRTTTGECGTFVPISYYSGGTFSEVMRESSRYPETDQRHLTTAYNGINRSNPSVAGYFALSYANTDRYNRMLGGDGLPLRGYLMENPNARSQDRRWSVARGT